MIAIEDLAEKLYLAYWAPTAQLTGRTVAAFADLPPAEKRAWYAVAREAVRLASIHAVN